MDKDGNEPGAGPRHRLDGLHHIRHWVFDLDNTLYPADSRLFHQIDRRMGEFVADLLDLDFDAARLIQKTYFRDYGTTLRGLMIHHRVDPHAYLDFVHDIDLSVLPNNRPLVEALARIEGRKVIFTNASRSHAEQIVEHLGIASHFDGIFDIHDADYVPKPESETYDRFIAAHGVAPGKAVLFEDSVANLHPAAALGMTTVLVRPGEDGVENDASDGAVHHVTDDLAAWLHEAASAIAVSGGG
jgi:putative hydrolase of the HAD superfamily